MSRYTREDFRALDVVAREAKAGDRRAAGELLVRLRPMLRAEARRWHLSTPTVGIGQEDCEQIAAMGLLRALDTWQPGRLGFAGYAPWWVRGYLRKATRGRGAEQAVLDAPLGQSGPEAHTETRQQVALVRAAIEAEVRAVRGYGPRRTMHAAAECLVSGRPAEELAREVGVTRQAMWQRVEKLRDGTRGRLRRAGLLGGAS